MSETPSPRGRPWAPGQSGNPKGRTPAPRAPSLTTALRAAGTPEKQEALAQEVWRVALDPAAEPSLRSKAWQMVDKLGPMLRNVRTDLPPDARTAEAHAATLEALADGAAPDVALAPLRAEKLVAEATAIQRGIAAVTQGTVVVAFPSAVVPAGDNTPTARTDTVKDAHPETSEPGPDGAA